MKFGGPEGFPKIPAESGDKKQLQELEEAAAVLTERSANLPPSISVETESEFGSEDLGPTIRKLIDRE